MIAQGLLDILCCPETHQTLALAEPSLIQNLNQRIDAGQVRNRSGKVVAERLDGGLVRSDRQVLYPVRQQIPIMLIDESIALEGMT